MAVSGHSANVVGNSGDFQGHCLRLSTSAGLASAR